MMQELSERDLERFWAKVIKFEDGCWEFTSLSTQGYGQFTYGSQTHTAHRISFFIAHGEIDRSLQVCHTCDNTPCVRPDHLWQGTPSDNIRDAVAKGRMGGERWHGRAPLVGRETAQAISSALKTMAPGEFQKDIARRFGVSPMTVSDIKTGQHWTQRA